MTPKDLMLSEAIKRGAELTRENRKLKREVNLWHNLFNDLLAYHFAEGGSAPNLSFDRITNDEACEDFYELINNNDYLTAVMK